MKTDFYTKAILTIIALCLTIIALNQVNIIPNTHANNPTTNLNPNLNYGLVPLNADGSIDVKVTSGSTMDVNIESCSSTAFYLAEPIKVEID